MAIDQAIKKLNNLTLYINSKYAAARFAVNLANELSSQTPIDTGAARSNWAISVDVPDTSFDKGKTDGRIKSKPVSRLNNFRTLFITNNAPYIVRLNEGHSPQAPARFVERAVFNSVNKFQRIIQNDLRSFANRGSLP